MRDWNTKNSHLQPPVENKLIFNTYLARARSISTVKWPRLIRCKLLTPNNMIKFSNIAFPYLRNWFSSSSRWADKLTAVTSGIDAFCQHIFHENMLVLYLRQDSQNTCILFYPWVLGFKTFPNVSFKMFPWSSPNFPVKWEKQKIKIQYFLLPWPNWSIKQRQNNSRRSST